MSIGQMRHRLGVGAVVRNEDDYGGTERADEVKDAVWASIDPASAREVYHYGQLEQIVTHKIKMRWRPDVKQGITLFGQSEKFYVVSVTNPDRRKRFLEVMARSGGAL